jgi:hypothetical protein
MLKGTIGNFTLPDIFRLLSFTNKTGRLEVVRSAGDGRVFFLDGDVCFAQSSFKHELLGQRLIAAGALTESDLKRALDTNAQTGERLGRILLAQGSISEEQLNAALRGQIQDAAIDLLRWDVGAFEFESDGRLGEEIPISVSVETLIMESARRLEELELIKKKIPSHEVVVVIARAPEGEPDISLTLEEQRVLTLLDGRRTVGEVCSEANLDKLSGYRILYGFVSAGLADVVTLRRAPKAPPTAPPPIGPPAPPREHADVSSFVAAPPQAAPVSNGVSTPGAEGDTSARTETEARRDGDDGQLPPIEDADESTGGSNIDRATLVRELASLFSDEEIPARRHGADDDSPPDDTDSSKPARVEEGEPAARRSLLRRRGSP